MTKLLFIPTLILLSSALNAQKVKEQYHPEKDFELRVDTTINSKNIYWNFKTIRDSFVIQEFQEGNKLYKVHYRDSELLIGLPYNSLRFDKMSFDRLIEHDYFEEFIFHRTFFEGFNDTSSELKFLLTITKPETDWTYPIYLYVNLKGTSRFELAEFEDDY